MPALILVLIIGDLVPVQSECEDGRTVPPRPAAFEFHAIGLRGVHAPCRSHRRTISGPANCLPVSFRYVWFVPVWISKIGNRTLQLVFYTRLTSGYFALRFIVWDPGDEWVADCVTAKLKLVGAHKPDLVPSQHFVVPLTILLRAKRSEYPHKPSSPLHIRQVPQRFLEPVVAIQPFLNSPNGKVHRRIHFQAQILAFSLFQGQRQLFEP